MLLRSSKVIWDTVKDYGLQSPDAEVVGALIGQHLDDKTSECDEFIPLKNVADQNAKRQLIGTQELYPSVHYVPDPNEFYQVLFKTRLMRTEADKDFVGIFHTHPHHQAQPSLTDIHGAGYAGFYPIFSLKDDEINLFYYDGMNRYFERAELEITG